MILKQFFKVQLLLVFVLISQYFSAQCPTSIVIPSSVSNGTSATSAINGNGYRLGNSVFSFANTSTQPFTSEISTSHQTAKGIRIEHSGGSSAPNTFARRVEAELSFSQPVYGLNFNINDVDDNDIIRIQVYDQNNILIPHSASNYTVGSTITTGGSPNFEFLGGSADISSSNSVTTARIAASYAGQYVSRVVIQYYDTANDGSYTIAAIAGASLCAQNDAFGNVQLGTATTASVFANDLSSTGAVASATNTDVTLTNLGGLTGATINANGTINVPANATPGAYSLTYRICSPSGQTNFCTTATVSLTVLACQAGTAAPVLIAGGFYDAVNSAHKIPCGSTTANLSTITANNKPAPATVTLTWHTGTPATDANKIATTTTLTGTTRYYASFFDSVANCYSPTKEIMVFAPICGRNNDFTSISITAGVGGTLPSIFANDSYNGLTITDITTITAQQQYELWTPSNAIINNNGTLTIPASVLPGIYTYYYKLVDTDPDIGILINQASNIEVKFRVSPNTDGDAYNDYDDWDDDNDGILDAVESPPCFYSSTEASIIENITSPFDGAAGDPTVGTTISSLFNGSGSDANPFNFTGQTIASGSPIFTISYPAMIRLTSLSVNQAANGMAPANRFGRLFGSNDGVNFTAISAATGVALNSATVTFAVTSTVSYRFYEIRYVGTVASGNLTDGTLGTANIQEITAVYNLLAYEPSANPKPITCTFSTDSDGIPNHLDVDSDGDNCFDAIEGDENVTAGNLDGNGRITGGVNANGVPGLVNSLGAADVGGDVGQGIGFSQISTITECLDTDGDGIADACDLDDDNDGILDLNENSCVLTGQTIRIGYIPNSRSLSADNGYTFDGQYMNGSGALKLTNPANFGPSGIVNANIVLVNMGTAPITKAIINSLNLNVIFLGGIDNGVTTYIAASEFDAIKDWSDDSPKNMVVSTQFQTLPWGANITAANLNPNVPTPLGSQTPIFNGPFGNVTSFTQGGTFQAHFSSINSVCSISPLAVDGNNRAVIYVDGAYNDIMIADVDILTTIGSVTSGNAITSNNDRVFANFWAFVAQQSACADKDTDGDGIPDRLDLDADNDGCPDAIEGSSTTITSGNLVNSTISGGNTGATSGAYNLPVIQNLGNTVNTSVTSESYGVPTIAGTGQAIGTSQTANPVLIVGTAGSNQSIVTGSTPAALTLTGSTGTIQWQVSADNVTFANVASGGTTATYSPGTLTATRYYRTVVTSAGGCTAISNVVTIQVGECFTGTDSDGDGISDVCDLDDDNDGILDSAEMGACTSPSVVKNVYLQTFGTIAAPGRRTTPLAANEGTSGLSFLSTNPTSEGAYSLTTNPDFVDDFGGTFNDQWIHVNDHTGNTNGLMMICNPNTTAAIIWQSPNIQVNVGAGLQVNLWALNLKAAGGTGFTLPNLRAELFNASNNSSLGFVNTGNIPQTGNWQNVVISLPTNLSATSVYIRITSAATTFNGNDFALDDISINETYCDTDGDGIPNHLDLDSDNDGCSDAIEGSSTTITTANLVNSSMPGGNTGATSGTYNQPVIQNLGNAVNTTSGSANYGVPTIAGTGQGVGDSANSLVNSCVCYEDPTLVAGATYPVKHGITLLGRAGKISTVLANGVSDWPMNKNSAYTVLESKTKGFVVTRNSSPETTITIPVVGMMVFDTDENAGAGCLKIYTGPGSTEGWKCFSTQGCP